MSEHTRRGFMAIAGAGAAAVAAQSAMAGAAGRVAQAPAPDSTGTGGNVPIVAYLEDLDRGEIVVICGERQTVVTDRALASGLARIASEGGA